ncbi:hypothetical protein FA15DRAFT_690272 [Coprinopsis marcescibilis]|uniref:Uncharacterized protein n=1 Tax=Coprinopsis marcescibilis TaxID=230819 RepID=A0A5C3LCJ9_COPMA|nr:hypothetical protein FA15DRAFT_690272 [Coprinopsis marcescibilis]
MQLVHWLQTLYHAIGIKYPLLTPNQVRPSFLEIIFWCRETTRSANASQATRIQCGNIAESVLHRVICLTNPLAPHIFTPSDDLLPESLRNKKEMDVHNAIKQFPDSWEMLPSVLSRTIHSPVAQRTALRLLFSAYAAVDGSVIPHRTAEIILKHLFECIENSLHGHSILAMDASLTENSITATLFLRLFSKVHSKANAHGSPPLFRPRCFAFMLELVALVMGEPRGSTCIPLNELTDSQRLLLECEQFVSWAWLTWTDDRVENSEQVEFLTSTWFFWVNRIHVNGNGNGKKRPCLALKNAVLREPDGAKSILARILRSLHQETRRNGCVPSIVTVLANACLALLSISQLHGSWKIDSNGSCCLEHIIDIFLALGTTPDELYVQQIILEILCLYDPMFLSRRMESTFRSPKHNTILGSLDEAITMCNVLIKRARTPDIIDQDGCLRSVRLFLDFMTLVWHTKSDSIKTFPGLALIGSITELLDEQSAQLPRSQDYQDLRNSVFAAVTEHIQDPALFDYVSHRKLRRLAFSVTDGSHDLPTASAYAYYVLLRETPMESRMLSVATWNYLQNSLTGTLAGAFNQSCEDENLSLLCSTGICVALLKLLRLHPELKDYVLGTPWSRSLYISLRALFKQGDTPSQTRYITALRSRLDLAGKSLLRLLSSAGNRDTVPEFSAKLLFYRSELGRWQMITKVEMLE